MLKLDALQLLQMPRTVAPAMAYIVIARERSHALHVLNMMFSGSLTKYTNPFAVSLFLCFAGNDEREPQVICAQRSFFQQFYLTAFDLESLAPRVGGHHSLVQELRV